MNFGARHYVPILKAKPGEKAALRAVGAPLCSLITPLLEIVERKSVPSGKPDEPPKPPPTMSAHLDTAFDDLAAAVKPFQRCLLDARAIADDEPSAATAVFERASKEGMTFTPVTGISRAADVAAALRHSSGGIAIRLTREEFTAQRIPRGLPEFMAQHGLDHAETDLILDLGSVDDLVPDGVAALTADFMADVPDQTRWRTLTVSASAFPKSMGVVERHSHRCIERSEWKAWRDSLYANRRDLPRLPTYSDYAIQHPKGVEGFDYRKMKVAAAIRYTLGEEWLLIKGESTGEVSPSEQFPGLAKRLVLGQFRGSFQEFTHCKGCASMKRAAIGAPGMASAQVWRRIGTIHHISVVVQALAALPWP